MLDGETQQTLSAEKLVDVIGERQQALNAALAEGATADDRGSLEVLERSADDLRSAGARTVDKNDHRVVRTLLLGRELFCRLESVTL